MSASADLLIARVIATRGPLLTPALVAAKSREPASRDFAVAGRIPAASSPAVEPVAAAPAWGALAVVPATWLRVPGSDLCTPAQRFAAFLTDRGRGATLHTAYGLDPTPPSGRLVALVNLGGQRVAVETLAADRHAAQWTRGRETHRLTVTPAGLGDFMELLLRLDFAVFAHVADLAGNPGAPGH